MEEVPERTFPSPAFRNALKRTVDQQRQAATTARLFPSENVGMKRARPWTECDDVGELKRMLGEKDEELAEKSHQLAELERKLKAAAKKQTPTAAEGIETSTPSNSKPLTAKQLETLVSKLRRSIRSQVVNQMVYKRSSSGGSKLAPVEIFDVLECTIASLVGAALYAEASSGPKQLKLVLSNEDVEAIFDGRFSKKLRFGADLELTKGLALVYSKENSTLKITGAYKMFK